jgi:hypothetical protein
MTISGSPVEEGSPNDYEVRLDRLFRAYRAACPVTEQSPNFMPDVWAGIEGRRVSMNWFGRFARVLVTAALAASVVLGIMGIMASSTNQSNAFFDVTFVEALRADHASNLEPLHLDRISELEP